MRTLLLVITLSLSLQTTFAASAAFNPPKKLYEKGKGTLGLILGLTTGPFGYLGVCLCSHNLTQRKKAKKGMEIFGAVVITTAFIWLIVLSAKGGGGKGGGGGRGPKHLGRSNNNINLDLPSGGQKKKQQPPPPPVLGEDLWL